MKTPEVVEAIVRTVAPYLGEAMARAATLGHCRKLGISEAEMTREEADALLSQIGLGLNVFLGRKRSSEVLLAMRSAIGEGP